MTRAIRAVDAQGIWTANLQTGDLEKTKPKDSAETPVEFEVRNVGRGDNLLTETEAFILAIQGKASGAVTGLDGQKALDLVEQILRLKESQKGP